MNFQISCFIEKWKKGDHILLKHIVIFKLLLFTFAFWTEKLVCV